MVLLFAVAAPESAWAQRGWPPFEPQRPQPPWRSSGDRSRREREPWMRKSLQLGSGMALAFDPVELSKWYSPRPGLAIQYVHPVWPVLDVRVGFETLDMAFDEGRFRRERGVPTSSVSRASIGAASVGIAAHPDREGLQGFVSLAAMLPDVSEPGIFYTDLANQPQSIDGTEIFGFDPGFTVGGGVAFRSYGAIGGELEARLWLAPGRTKPAVVLMPIRATVSIPLPGSW
jgi:hypothetical protein